MTARTYAELVALLAKTKGKPIVERMKAVHGERITKAFENGNWSGVSFKGQDCGGLSFQGSNLAKTKWNAMTNVAGCNFEGAAIDKAILKANGIDRAHFDGEQRALIDIWTSPEQLPLGVNRDNLHLAPDTEFTPPQCAALIKHSPDFETAEGWLAWMRKVGGTAHCGMITIVISKPRIEAGEEAIADLVQPLIDSGEADQLLINAAIGHVDTFDTAKYWFNSLFVRGFVPDPFSYNSLIRLADYKQGRELITELEGRGLRPDEYSYNSVLRLAPTLDAGFALLVEMEHKQLVPRMLDYYALFYVAKGHADQVRVRQRMEEAGLTPDRDCFNRMLNGADNLDQATGLWRELIELGMTPDAFTARGMLSNCKTIDEAFKVFQLLRTASRFPSMTQAEMTLLRLDPEGRHGPYQEVMDNAKARGVKHFKALRDLFVHCAPDGGSLFDDLFVQSG
jgi:Pentatricopeptide repeat domain